MPAKSRMRTVRRTRRSTTPRPSSFPPPPTCSTWSNGRKPGSLYTRYGLNPTIQALEAKLASLEGAEMAWAFCSGMAAEAALFLTHGREGIVCLGDAYGGTLELLGHPDCACSGIRTHLLLGSELDLAESRLARWLRTGLSRNADQSRRSKCSTSGAIADMCHRHARPAGGRQHLRLAGEPAPAGTRRRFRGAQRHQVSRRPFRPHRRRADGLARTC